MQLRAAFANYDEKAAQKAVAARKESSTSVMVPTPEIEILSSNDYISDYLHTNYNSENNKKSPRIHYREDNNNNNNNNNNDNNNTNSSSNHLSIKPNSKRNSNRNSKRNSKRNSIKKELDYNNSGEIILKKGWLTKRGDIIRNWKRRYCILIGQPENEIRYYEPSKLDKPKGVLKIDYVILASQLENKELRSLPTGSSPAFKLITYKRKWIFICDSNEEKDSWLEHIHDVMSSLAPEI
eukprot:TRINITY_DN2611_c0_g1_i1.p1 TRINITY_DN2611_c0_g1~~TRINITY_DN2611_c0_g1_i1.p1  ORF type:complete len:238 (+),score=68.18 TRINITY_DN2611_c0_g1_i1:104-817(+)